MKPEEKKIEEYIEGVYFDFDGAHIAVTSGAGAASGMNEPYLLKAKGDIDKTLTEEEIDILRQIGELPENFVNKKENNTMSEEIMKEMKDEIKKLKEQLSVSDAVNLIKNYKFENESDIAKALSKLTTEDRETIVKVFEDFTKEIEKSVKEVEDNPLKKALDKEVGYDDKETRDVDKEDKELSTLEKTKARVNKKFKKETK